MELNLIANVEGTLNFAQTVTQISVKNVGDALIYILPDRTVENEAIDAYRIGPYGRRHIVFEQGCDVLHAISSANAKLEVSIDSTKTMKFRETLQANMESVVNFAEIIKKCFIVNNGQADVYVAPDETATINGENTYKIPAGTLCRSNIKCMSLHFISGSNGEVDIYLDDSFEIIGAINGYSETQPLISSITGLNINAGNLSVIQTLAPAERVGDQLLVSALGLSVAASATEDTYVIDCQFYSRKTILLEITGSSDVSVQMKVGDTTAPAYIPVGTGFSWLNLAVGKHALAIRFNSIILYLQFI